MPVRLYRIFYRFMKAIESGGHKIERFYVIPEVYQLVFYLEGEKDIRRHVKFCPQDLTLPYDVGGSAGQDYLSQIN